MSKQNKIRSNRLNKSVFKKIESISEELINNNNNNLSTFSSDLSKSSDSFLGLPKACSTAARCTKKFKLNSSYSTPNLNRITSNSTFIEGDVVDDFSLSEFLQKEMLDMIIEKQIEKDTSKVEMHLNQLENELKQHEATLFQYSTLYDLSKELYSSHKITENLQQSLALVDKQLENKMILALRAASDKLDLKNIYMGSAEEKMNLPYCNELNSFLSRMEEREDLEQINNAVQNISESKCEMDNINQIQDDVKKNLNSLNMSVLFEAFKNINMEDM